MTRFLAASLLALFIIAAAPAAQAGVIEDAQRQSDQIMRDQQQRMQEDRMRMESHRPQTRIETPLPPTQKGAGAGCWPVDKIVLKGATRIPADEQEKLTAHHLHKCLGVDEVQALLSDITAWYINHGLTTSRAYLPEQDLSKKTLTIEVIEGRVEKLRLQKGDKGSLYLPGAFPGVEGHILNLRDIEQGLDQLNRLPSNNATVDIAPGTKPGESDVTIRNTPGDRLHASLSGDNMGSRSTGQEQASLTLGYDDLLGINDQASLTGRRSAAFGEWDRHSNAVNGFYSIPYGYTMVTMGFSYSDYESRLFTAGPTLRLNGDSSSQFVTVDRTLYRSQTGKLTASGTLTTRQQNNFIADNKLDVSSRPETVLDLGTTYSAPVAGGMGSLGLTYSRGLGFLGAHHDASALPNDAAHAQFNKFSLNASWMRGFQLAGQDLSWSSQLTAQHAPLTLYGADQVSIGGYYTVRGFYEKTLANDDGGYIRNDLALRKSLGTLWGQDVSARPYIALDAGKVGGGAQGTPHGFMLGSGLGGTVTAGKATFEIFTGRPISQPSSFSGEGWHGLARLTIAFQ